MISDEFQGGKTIFLITNTFPFGRGEEFIESELPHLAEAFDSVVIVATQPHPEARLTREVLRNCTVFRAGGPRPSGKAALGTLLRGAMQRLRSPWGSLPLAPTRLAMEAMFEGRAANTMRALIQQLTGPDFGTARLGRIDTAVVYSYWLHVTARVALLLDTWLRSQGVRISTLLSRAHRYDLYPTVDNRGYLPERRLLMSGMDHVFPVSDAGTAFLQQSQPEFAHKVSTRRLGSTEPGATVDCRQNPAHLVSCSYLVPVKRVWRMPQIIALAAKALGREIRWTHFGDGESRAAVEAAIHDAGISQSSMLAGHVPNEQLPDHYQRLRPSAFLNLSASEGLPVSMMEVSSLRIPVIATNVGGVAEIVRDGVNGYLLPADFTDEQAACVIVRLLSHTEAEYQGLCCAARALWEEHYDQQRNYSDFASELRSLT